MLSSFPLSEGVLPIPQDESLPPKWVIHVCEGLQAVPATVVEENINERLNECLNESSNEPSGERAELLSCLQASQVVPATTVKDPTATNEPPYEPPDKRAYLLGPSPTAIPRQILLSPLQALESSPTAIPRQDHVSPLQALEPSPTADFHEGLGSRLKILESPSTTVLQKPSKHEKKSSIVIAVNLHLH